MLLPPVSDIHLPKTERTIDRFAQNHGFDGYLFDYTNQEYLKVKQLDFSTVYHGLGNYPESKIPKEETSDYWKAIMMDGLIAHAHECGGQYNLPQGSWQKEKTENLPIVGLVRG